MIQAMDQMGRVLVLGDQGVNRCAAVTMAFLIQHKKCTLEDAFYYVKSLRSAVQPDSSHLNVLAQMEVDIFGKKITAVEDLW